MFLLVFALIVIGMAMASPLAYGQEIPQPRLEPPVLVEDVEPSYPSDGEGREGEVLLLLTLDVDGNVATAAVDDGLGPAFDAAAIEAAKRLRFSPAKRDGVPIPARIRFRMLFRAPPPPTGALLLELFTADGQPAAGRSVRLSSPNGSSTSTRTDDAGKARFDGLSPGSHAVLASGGETAEVEILAGRTTSSKLMLAASGSPAPAPVAVEVQVEGERGEGDLLEDSTEAVRILDFREARTQSADVSEVLAREAGVTMQRGGGLGSQTRFCLNGLCDEQIAKFVDGIPLEAAGFPSGGSFGLQLIPVSFVERVEVYRGVVPVRLGADALGGAINIVTDQSFEPALQASYQIGSFGTHLVTADGRYKHDPSGFVVAASGLFSRTDNDYEVDVEVADERGRLRPERVRRFHDGFDSYGGSAELGFVDRPWAKRLTIKGFGSTYDKEVQHDIVMTVPYGDVTSGETILGGVLRYDQDLFENVELTSFVTYARRTIDFVDRGEFVYNWFGERVRERRVAGEIQSTPTDQTIWQDTGLGRLTLTWSPHGQHELRLATSPYFATRTGDDRLVSDPGARDPLEADRRLFRMVSGAEYELRALPTTDHLREADFVFKNTFFVKSYLYATSSEELLPGGVVRRLDNETHDFGFGNGLRFRASPWIVLKASYEYTTRLPSVDEVFGDGALIRANLELEPERSHNTNLQAELVTGPTELGEVVLDVNGFWRESDRQIVFLSDNRFFQFQNVFEARTLGVESTLAWTSPGAWLRLNGTATYQDIRNISSEGIFGDFAGDRIPNRPFLTASWGARGVIRGVPDQDDTIEPFYIGRFVDEFFRGWESVGLREFKQTVDSQITHTVGLSYVFSSELARGSASLEVANLTDEAVFDFFGVQRPGRAFFFKLVGEI